MKKTKDIKVFIIAGCCDTTGEANGMIAGTPTFLYPIQGRPIIKYVIDSVREIAPLMITVVVESGTDVISEITEGEGRGLLEINDKTTISDFLLEIDSRLSDFDGRVLFVSGDMPLFTSETLNSFIENYTPQGHVTHDYAEGGERKPRIAIGSHGEVEKPINLFVTDTRFLSEMENIPKDPFSKGSLFSFFNSLVGQKGNRFRVSEEREFIEIKDRKGIALASKTIRERISGELMESGVTVIDPERVYIDCDVKIGRDTILYPDTYIEGKTVIGNGCLIEPNVKIVDSTLGDDVSVKMCSHIMESRIGNRVSIGPFANLRPKTELHEDVKIGNFVEIKKSRIKKGTKASHLAYIGDAEIGEGVNVGAGTITCNYDGVNKHKTEIGDGVFIGSDTQLIAPVKVGRYALIGAGSTISRDVPENALAVSRSRQTHYPDRGFRGKKKK